MCFFLQNRHPKLRQKTSTDLSVARAKKTNWTDVLFWFLKYNNALQQLGINTPEQVWNVDEHGTEHSPKIKKVVGEVGQKSYTIQAGEKSLRSTMLTYVNAAGRAVPPLVIHKGRYNPSWENGKPEGREFINLCSPTDMCNLSFFTKYIWSALDVLVRGSHKGYINKQLFAEYGKSFILYLREHNLLDRPHILLIDSHYSHVFNYGFMKMMDNRKITVRFELYSIN